MSMLKVDKTRAKKVLCLCIMSIINQLKSIIKEPETPQAASPQPNTSAKKVLIVEDEKLLADALTAQLTHDGFQVIRAENGEVGLQLIASQKPDAVLLDLLMPVMD